MNDDSRVLFRQRPPFPVAPANAGTHTPYNLVLVLWPIPSEASKGRWLGPGIRGCDYISDLILRSAPLRASRRMAASPRFPSILRDACFASSSG